jgi:hypothetical protein
MKISEIVQEGLNDNFFAKKKKEKLKKQKEIRTPRAVVSVKG